MYLQRLAYTIHTIRYHLKRTPIACIPQYYLEGLIYRTMYCAHPYRSAIPNRHMPLRQQTYHTSSRVNSYQMPDNMCVLTARLYY